MKTHNNRGGVTPPLQKDLPEGWVWKTIGDVCDILSGYGFPKNLQGKSSGDLPFYKVGDISQAWLSGNRYLIKSNNYLSQEEAKKIKAEPLPAGTTVMAKIGEAIKLNRRALLAKPSLVDNNVMGIFPKPDYVDQKYNFYYLLTISLGDYSQATTVPSVRKSDVSKIFFPLAPLDQQKLIVAEIEKQFSRLDEAVTALKRIQANVKRYKASVLKAAVEGKLTEQWRKEHPDVEPASELLKRILAERRKKWEEDYVKKYVGAHGHAPKDDSWKKKYKEPASPDAANLPELPKGWVWCSFDAISILITDGKHGDCKDDENSGYFFLSAKDINNGRLNYTNARQINKQEFLEVHYRTNLEFDDVLITNAGTIGRVAVAKNVDKLKFTTFQKSVAIIKPIKKYIVSEYLAYFLEASVKSMQAKSQGTAVNNLLLRDLRTAVAALPPLEEQREIVAEIERLLSISYEVEAVSGINLKRAERLRQAILKKAFSGQLGLSMAHNSYSGII